MTAALKISRVYHLKAIRQLVRYKLRGKSQHVQVTLVFVVTNGGLPVDYELLVGNTHEGSTFKSASLRRSCTAIHIAFAHSMNQLESCFMRVQNN